jgi:hypothetical protein
MLQTLSVSPARRSLEFGIYRDGDNNLDAIQESTLAQALRTSATDSRIEFTVEDTTRLHAHGDAVESGELRTEHYIIADGGIGQARAGAAQDMSDEKNLAEFVARTLDNAQSNGAKQTWVELVDHGGGDGGGLETADGSVMSMPGIARAIAEGVAMHAAAHPEDAGRSVDGVVANQCLMDTLGFAEGYYIGPSNVRSKVAGEGREGGRAKLTFGPGGCRGQQLGEWLLGRALAC